MILKSTVLPVSGSLDCGWWHVTHCAGFVQRPPCAASELPWQDEQAWSVTSSRAFGAAPSGRADAVSRSNAATPSNVRVANAATVCVFAVSSPVSGAAIRYVYVPCVTSTTV
jgi:hypothetical protein